MKDRYQEITRYWVMQGTYQGNPFYNAELKIDYRDFLQVFVDVHDGDHVTVNPQEYYKATDQRYSGTAYYRVPALDIEIRTTGTQGGTCPIPTGYNLYDLSTREEALGKLYEQARGQIDLSIDLMQIRQTAALAAKLANLVTYVKKHPIDALRKSFTYFTAHGVKGKSPKVIAKDAGSLWLEYIYGLKPTVQTLYDTAIELARSQEPYMKVEATASSKRNTAFEEPFWDTPSPGKQVGTASSSTRYKFFVKMRASADALNQLSHFTSLNPASIAWEMTPFSFVVDWAYDVGGYLRALESAFLTDSLFETGYAVATLKMQSFSSMYYHSEDSDGNVSTWDLKGAYTKISAKSRIRLSGMPFPRAPTFKTDLSSARAMNAAALLSQFFKTGK